MFIRPGFARQRKMHEKCASKKNSIRLKLSEHDGIFFTRRGRLGYAAVMARNLPLPRIVKTRHLIRRLTRVVLPVSLLPLASGAPLPEPRTAGRPIPGPVSSYYYASTLGSDDQDGRTLKTAWHAVARLKGARLRPGNVFCCEAGRTWPVAAGLPCSSARAARRAGQLRGHAV